MRASAPSSSRARWRRRASSSAGGPISRCSRKPAARTRSSSPRSSPGIKLGVRPGSFLLRTECFGPVLGLMRADNLDHAIELVNAQPFGLTSGIQTLDDREIERWVAGIDAGNLYVNRPITGAIVGRQPFGGWKASSVGPGAKAGGPNYVLQLARWRQVSHPAGGDEPLPESMAALLERCVAELPDDNARALVRAA